MSTTSGDAMIFAADPSQIIIFIRQRPLPPILIDPPGQQWHHWVEGKARPALAAAGWRLDTWHRPRNNPDVLATAFVWRP